MYYKFDINYDLVFNVNKSYFELVDHLYSGIFPKFLTGSRIMPRRDSIVYLGINFKFGLELFVDFSDRCRKFLASVSSVLKHSHVI